MAKRKKKSRKTALPRRMILVLAAFSFLAVLLCRALFHNSLTVSGQGYLGIALQWFLFCTVPGMGGLYCAVSRMVSLRLKKGTVKNAKKAVTVAMSATILTGLALTAVLFFLGPVFAEKVSGSVLSRPAVMAMSASVLPLCVTAVLMGGLDGFGFPGTAMFPGVAGSLGFLILGSYYSSACRAYGDQVGALLQNPEYGPAYAAMGVAIGMGIGSWIGFAAAILGWLYKKRSVHVLAVHEIGGNPESKRNMLRGVEKSRMPGMLMIWIPLCFILIQNVLFYRTAKTIEGNSYFFDWGSYLGIAGTIVTIGLFGIMGFSARQIPGLKVGFEQRNLKKCRTRLLVSMRAMAVMVIPFAVYTMVLAKPLTGMFFGENAGVASTLLLPCGIAFIFWGVAALLGCVLWSMKRELMAIGGMLLAGIATIGYDVIFLARAKNPVQTLGWGNLFGAFVLCLVYYAAVTRAEKIRINWIRVFLAPVLGGVALGMVCWFMQYFLGKTAQDSIVCVCCIAVSGVIYLVAEVALRGLDERILAEYPGGQKCAAVLRSLRLL